MEAACSLDRASVDLSPRDHATVKTHAQTGGPGDEGRCYIGLASPLLPSHCQLRGERSVAAVTWTTTRYSLLRNDDDVSGPTASYVNLAIEVG